MSEQFTVTVPVVDLNGDRRCPKVGVMSATRARNTGEMVYVIELDFPVGATQLVAFAQGSGLARADDSPDGPSTSEAVKVAGF